MARHIPGPLHFVQQGADGMPMLFIHSTPDDHRLWYIQTAHFSSWYRTIAVDLAGYGHSPAPQQGVQVTDQSNIDQLHDLGIVPASFDVARYADFSLVDEAAARLGK